MAETTPYPFQAVDISKVDYKFGGRGLVAWDMGCIHPNVPLQCTVSGVVRTVAEWHKSGQQPELACYTPGGLIIHEKPTNIQQVRNDVYVEITTGASTVTVGSSHWMLVKRKGVVCLIQAKKLILGDCLAYLKKISGQGNTTGTTRSSPKSTVKLKPTGLGSSSETVRFSARGITPNSNLPSQKRTLITSVDSPAQSHTPDTRQETPLGADIRLGKSVCSATKSEISCFASGSTWRGKATGPCPKCLENFADISGEDCSTPTGAYPPDRERNGPTDRSGSSSLFTTHLCAYCKRWQTTLNWPKLQKPKSYTTTAPGDLEPEAEVGVNSGQIGCIREQQYTSLARQNDSAPPGTVRPDENGHYIPASCRNLKWMTVESVKITEHGPVYDLEMPCGNYFDANGLNHQNCGKSFGACHYFRDYLGRTGVMLVVCPNIARGTWAHEAARHLGMRAEMLYSRRPRVWRLGRPRAGVFVINYDVLHHWADALAALRPNLLVLDECQYLTNPDAARTRAAKHVSRAARHVLALSGTPLANRPIELWPVLNMLRPDKYPSRLEFAEKYCDLKMGKAGTLDVSGASRLPELHAELERDVMVRRRKEDVLADLPPRTRTVVPFTLPRAGAREYAAAAADFRQWLATHAPHLTRRERKAQRLAHLGHLKMTAAAHKLPAVLEWVQNFLDATDEKLVVFAHHRAVAEAVHRHFGRAAVLVHGGVTGDARRGAVERFNRVPAVRLFVGNLKAAGVAWSCTSADAVAFAEYWWNPATHTQAEDRVRGIGRGTGRPSRAYWLVAEGTIEETLCGILQRKQKIVDSVLDGGDAGTLDVMDELERALAAKPFGGRPCRASTRTDEGRNGRTSRSGSGTPSPPTPAPRS